MSKGRLEAFSDGVIAIILTIMVLELHPPHTAEWQTLVPLIPVFLSYLLSFIYIGIYWSNHHHLLQAIKQVNGPVLWANLHLLFWLSLVPFVTGWMGTNNFAPVPVAAYGIVLLFAAIAYYVLVRALIQLHGADSPLAKAIGSDFKGKISIVLYLTGIAASVVDARIGLFPYVLVAIIWLVPDRRIERTLAK